MKDSPDPSKARKVVLSASRKLKRSEVIAQTIVDHILRYGLSEGEHLPNEPGLLQSLSVGRATLREALRLLETRGVVTIRSGPGGGPIVRRPRPSDLNESLSLLLQFEGATIRDVMEARKALEPVVAGLALDAITPEDLEGLALTVERMRDHMEDDAVFFEESRKFHAGIARLTGSLVMIAIVEALHSLTSGISQDVARTPDYRASVVKGHDRIVHHLAEGSKDVTQAMFDHVAEAAVYWELASPGFMANNVRWTPLGS